MKQSLAALIMFSLIIGLSTTTTAQKLDSGLVAKYTFNNNLNDISGLNNHAVSDSSKLMDNPVSVTYAADRFGNPNYALYSDYNMGYCQNPISAPNINTLPIDFQYGFSVSFWLNGKSGVYTTGSKMTILDMMYHSMTNDGFYVKSLITYKDSLSLIFGCREASNSTLLVEYTSKYISLNEYHHVVITSLNGKVEMYVDDKLLYSKTKTNTNGVSTLYMHSPLIIGGVYSKNDITYNNHFVGILDDISIYNRVITADEIYALYTEPSPILPTTTVKKEESVIIPDTVNNNKIVTVVDELGTHTINVKTTDSISHNITVLTMDTVNAKLLFSKSKGATLVNKTTTVNISDVLSVNTNTTKIDALTNVITTDSIRVRKYVVITDSINKNVFVRTTDSIVNKRYIITVDTLDSSVVTNLGSDDNTSLAVYPNPTKDILTINIGSYSKMNSYTIKIVDVQGKVVFKNLCNQAQYSIDLNTFGSKGLYFIQILDSDSNVIQNKKIVLE